MVKLQLQYPDHLMQRAGSSEKTPMLGKTEGGRRGRQRMRWLDGISDSMDMNLSKLQKIVEDRGAWWAILHGIAKSETQSDSTVTSKARFNLLLVTYVHSHPLPHGNREGSPQTQRNRYPQGVTVPRPSRHNRPRRARKGRGRGQEAGGAVRVEAAWGWTWGRRADALRQGGAVTASRAVIAPGAGRGAALGRIKAAPPICSSTWAPPPTECCALPSPQREGTIYRFLPHTVYNDTGNLKHEIEKKKYKKNNDGLSPPCVLFSLFSFLPFSPRRPPPLPRMESECPGEEGAHLAGTGWRTAVGLSCHHAMLALHRNHCHAGARSARVSLVSYAVFRVFCLGSAWSENTRLRHRSFLPETGHLRPWKRKSLAGSDRCPLATLPTVPSMVLAAAGPVPTLSSCSGPHPPAHTRPLGEGAPSPTSPPWNMPSLCWVPT